MPSGRTHDRITLWGLPLVAGATLVLTASSRLTLIVATSYLVSGLMFGPDLDIHSRQFQRWGPLRWIWRPYQNTLHHRSLWSHGFLIGTILRVLYLCIWIAGIALLGWAIVWGYQQFASPTLHHLPRDLLSPRFWKQMAQALQQDGITLKTWFWPKHFRDAIATFVGLEAGAMSHSVSDWLGSMWKQWQKKTSAKTSNRGKSQR